eukprot:Blabericola_migrator_1__1578@NODE_141_length_13107_cov_85_385736_g123_i0_p14_GENE_NODE_141_length_13107_cov_85_385736_g123_i0NODE_141_length_13107_cov_85_385736_g123_i0_p14_ORF_typecomplete_len103_score24_30Med5/PF08689_10/0_0095IL11/PF07400_11/0_012NPHI_C/PF08469_10/0_054_NODE_141_length_13107_cov_85_385736_g123_i087849092
MIPCLIQILTFGVDEVLLELQRNPQPSFEIIQMALKSESVACSEESLTQLENDIMTIFGRHLEWILNSQKKAEKMIALQEEYKCKLGRLEILGGVMFPWIAK